MKTVLITGAAGGIGSLIAKAYKEAGYLVVGIDRNKPNHNFLDKYYNTDINRIVEDEVYFSEWKTKFHEEIKNLNVLINNAAIQILGTVDELTHSDWHETFNVNLTAPFMFSKLFLDMLEKNNGCIINISSIHAKMTKPRFVAYATSKAALVGLTQSLAVDLGGGVRVNSISPAAIETEMLQEGFKDNEEGYEQLKSFHPTKTIGKPEDVAELSLFLSSDKAKFITGANFEIDGGISKRLHDPK
jgi:NAD(P)-dependent dehydrogenase (short-subunit alcohol dehydrogenase family)